MCVESPAGDKIRSFLQEFLNKKSHLLRDLFPRIIHLLLPICQNGMVEYIVSNQMLFFRRPRMMHPIHLLENFKLTLAFNLKLVGQLNPLLHPFFESVNPGFKVYIGDYLLFDYVISGELDDVSSSTRLMFLQILFVQDT